MAITEIKPKDQEELKQKVWERKPGEEASLIREVRSQFVGATAGSWRACGEGLQDVPVTTSCLVYIIIGKCKVGGEELSEPNLGEATAGYLITGETSIQLQSETIVIFFKY
ncbi:hypothetical protein V500_02147 [Pseudogymnoascus sp. VKM F-4518 (FW-2643)]|nr:hypothetical protein V500_02147 [Pseudogymnoascus sp. VKM F-4518 (FW-2643)]